MELVYLWVENYKNIQKQGFNFSPRFECKYDEKSNELTIDENKEYVSIFPENINITAIVGENGSGKSSLFKIIMKLITFNTLDYKLDFHSQKYEKSFALIYNKKIIKISLNDNIKQCIYNKNLIEVKSLNNNIDFFTIHFNYMLDTLYDNKNDSWIKKIYHKADSYQTPLLLEPYKNNNGKQQIDLDIIEYLNNQNMLRFYSHFDINKKIFEFFKPNKIIFRIATKKHIDILKPVLPKGDKGIYKEYRSIFYKFTQLYEINTFPKMGKNKSKLRSVYNRIINLYKKGLYKDISYLYIALKVLSSKEILFNKTEYLRIQNWAKKLESGEKLLSFSEALILNNLISNKSSKYEVRKIQICINFIEKEIYAHKNFTDNINKITNILEVKTILEFLPPWLDIEWFEDTKSIKSLSSGEKIVFTFIINLMYQIENINNNKKYKTINLFLDETELGLHPNWQKQYILKIIDALEQVNNKKINLFFATHSPFILSDLPKENVIFLEKGRQVNVNIETFGANIHTLLSHGFFMKDGLMGEFAKGKINETIKFLNKEQSEIKNEKEAKNIIDKIGELFLQEKLLELYDKKYPPSKEQKIQRLKKQIKELENADS